MILNLDSELGKQVVLWRLLSNPTSPLKRALAAYRKIDLSLPCPNPANRQPRRVIHRLTATEVDTALAEYSAGATLRELGARFRVDRTAVARALKARGVRLRRMPMTPAEVREAAVLYREGLSLAQVAHCLGHRMTTVHLRLREVGVQMRDAHGKER